MNSHFRQASLAPPELVCATGRSAAARAMATENHYSADEQLDVSKCHHAENTVLLGVSRSRFVMHFANIHVESQGVRSSLVAPGAGWKGAGAGAGKPYRLLRLRADLISVH